MPLENYTRGPSDPAIRHFTITPDSNADLPYRPSALWVKTGGLLVIRDIEGNDISYTVEAGMIIPFEAIRVMGTTTAEVIGWA